MNPSVATMSLVIYAWLAVVGACIGSFLNVVVYRLPAGKSIVHPGSRCPRCGHAIRWYHNLPVLGWLLLRGKCYDCQEPISLRYPLVEALVAVVFASLALIVLRQPAGEGAPVVLEPRAWAIYGSIVGLFCAVLAALLIRYDHQRVPRGVWLFAVLCLGGLLASLFL